jgi:uncharacterized protein (TIGR02118 family)
MSQPSVLALSSDPAATLALGRLLAERADVARCTVHVADDDHATAAPPFTGVLRLDGAAAVLDALASGAVRDVADVGVYRSRERHVKVRPVTWPAGAPSPGVGAVFATRRHPDLDHAQYDEHWRDVHAPLAVRHHVGMWDYWQCVLDEALAPGSPDYDGVAIVQFPSLVDLEERFFDGPEGRAIIQADAASFVDLAVLERVLMTEHILKS